jgi:acyl-CoA synthetase (AMP-forming)/AMP-acid ligase II
MFARELVKRCGNNFPTKVAYYCGERSRTWREMDRRSDRFGVALQQLGHRQGQTVAILAPEGIEVYEHFFACMKIAAPRVAVNTGYVWPEMLHVLKDSEVKFLLLDARCRDLVAGRMDELETLGITLIGYGAGHGLEYDYESLLANAEGEPDWPMLANDDILFFSYTSGTTGVPKGVMLPQLSGANCIIQSLGQFGFCPDDVWGAVGSSAWVVVMCYLLGLGNGMTTVIPDGGYQLQAYLRDVERFRITAGFHVPTMLQRAIAEIQSNPVYDLSSLRMMVYGSSPATPKLIRDARETFKGIKLLQIYGMTETAAGWVSYLTDADHEHALRNEIDLLKSVGRIGTSYDCTIRDEAGQPVPIGQSGEIWLRGNTMMKGYKNLPEATAEAMPDGWLRTNDIGRLDERGYLYLLDRQKFLISTGAVKVFPTTVEAILVEHPAVEEVAVVGVPHPEWGEAVVAVVVRKASQPDVTVQALVDFCRSKLSRPETPKYVVFVDQLPKTTNGKLKKAELRNWLSGGAVQLPWRVEPA